MLWVFRYTAFSLNILDAKIIVFRIQQNQNNRREWSISIISSLILTLYFPNNGCLPPVINMSSSRSRTRRTGWPVLRTTNLSHILHPTHPSTIYSPSIHPPIYLSPRLTTYPLIHLPFYPSILYLPSNPFYPIIHLIIHPFHIYSLSAYTVWNIDLMYN